MLLHLMLLHLMLLPRLDEALFEGVILYYFQLVPSMEEINFLFSIWLCFPSNCVFVFLRIAFINRTGIVTPYLNN